MPWVNENALKPSVVGKMQLTARQTKKNQETPLKTIFLCNNSQRHSQKSSHAKSFTSLLMLPTNRSTPLDNFQRSSSTLQKLPETLNVGNSVVKSTENKQNNRNKQRSSCIQKIEAMKVREQSANVLYRKVLPRKRIAVSQFIDKAVDKEQLERGKGKDRNIYKEQKKPQLTNKNMQQTKINNSEIIYEGRDGLSRATDYLGTDWESLGIVRGSFGIVSRECELEEQKRWQQSIFSSAILRTEHQQSQSQLLIEIQKRRSRIAMLYNLLSQKEDTNQRKLRQEQDQQDNLLAEAIKLYQSQVLKNEQLERILSLQKKSAASPQGQQENQLQGDTPSELDQSEPTYSFGHNFVLLPSRKQAQ